MKTWSVTPNLWLKQHEIKQLRKYAEDQSILGMAKKHVQPPRDWAIIDVALQTGLRASEIRCLKIGDLYIDRGQAHIAVVNGKGGKSRTVIIGDDLKRHLRDYIEYRRSLGHKKLYAGDYLFNSERADLMT